MSNQADFTAAKSPKRKNGWNPPAPPATSTTILPPSRIIRITAKCCANTGSRPENHAKARPQRRTGEN